MLNSIFTFSTVTYLLSFFLSILIESLQKWKIAPNDLVKKETVDECFKLASVMLNKIGSILTETYLGPEEAVMLVGVVDGSELDCELQAFSTGIVFLAF